MRQIIVGAMVSLDGVMQAPAIDTSWQGSVLLSEAEFRNFLERGAAEKR